MRKQAGKTTEFYRSMGYGIVTVLGDLSRRHGASVAGSIAERAAPVAVCGALRSRGFPPDLYGIAKGEDGVVAVAPPGARDRHHRVWFGPVAPR